MRQYLSCIWIWCAALTTYYARGDLCCIDPAKIQVMTLHEEFVISLDDALCPSAWQDIRDAVNRSYKKGLWINGPGDYDPATSEGLPATTVQVCKGEKRELIPAKHWNNNSETKKAICGGEMSACVARIIQSVLDQGKGGNATARLELLKQEFDTRTKEANKADVLFMNTWAKRQNSHPIHYDVGLLSVNFHINEGWEDTGTTFWRSRKEGCSYATQLLDSEITSSGEIKSKRKGKGSRKASACSNVDQRLPDGTWNAELSELYQKRGLPQPSSNFIDLEDPIGEFELAHLLDYRPRRLAIYTGHFFHAQRMPAAAADRLTADPTAGRLILHQFVALPLLAKDLEKVGRKLDIPNQEMLA